MCVRICFHKYLYMHTDTDFSCPPRYFCWSLKFQKHKRCKENFSVLHPKCMYLVHWLLLWFFYFFFYSHTPPSQPLPPFFTEFQQHQKLSSSGNEVFFHSWKGMYGVEVLGVLVLCLQIWLGFCCCLFVLKKT